jgi:hypothetical protein
MARLQGSQSHAVGQFTEYETLDGITRMATKNHWPVNVKPTGQQS